MSEQSTSVQVKILDKEYQVNCPPSDQEALIKSARYLDENMRKIKGRGNIHGVEKIAVMAALNITHDMLRKNRLINETRHATAQQVQGIEAKIDSAIAHSRQLEIEASSIYQRQLIAFRLPYYPPSSASLATPRDSPQGYT